jgi:hypothetical protein
MAWCIGYPIPCLGKASDPPLCLGGGLARCVSAGSCGCVLVRDRVTRCCMGVGEVHASRVVPVIVCSIVGLWAWWGFRCGLGIEVVRVVLCSLSVRWLGVGWSLLPVSCRSCPAFGLLFTLLCVVFWVGDACLFLVRSDSCCSCSVFIAMLVRINNVITLPLVAS